MKFSLKRFIIALLTTLGFGIYFVVVDPDNKLFQNLPWGTQLLLMLGVFVVASVGLWVIEIFYDFFLDPIYGKPGKLVEKAKEDGVGAGLALVARAINILAGAIVVGAAIVSLSVN